MKIAIREKELFPYDLWQDKFKDNEELLIKEPYNYTIIEVPYDDVEFEDLDIINSEIRFNQTKYELRKNKDFNKEIIDQLEVLDKKVSREQEDLIQLNNLTTNEFIQDVIDQKEALRGQLKIY